MTIGWGKRTQRIEKVFHLIGVAVAAVSIANGLRWRWFNPTNVLDVISIIPNAAASYAFMWGFGWMLARFGGDEEDKGSN
jgi:hypothetical protein